MTLKNLLLIKLVRATKYSVFTSRWCNAEILAMVSAIENKVEPNNEGFYELGDIEFQFLKTGKLKIPEDREPKNYWLDKNLTTSNNFHWIIKL